MVTRLIVLIDFSNDNLLKFAALWSELLKADVLLVHQVPSLIPSLADGESRALIIEQEKKDGLSRLKALVDDHFSPLKNVKYHVSEQPLLTTIETVTNHNSRYLNLVLAGLKTRGFFQQLMFGSTTSRLIDELNLPLIAIPANIEAFIPEKLILALNYRYPLNVKAFQEFVEAIKETIQVSEIISVVTPKDNEGESENYVQNLCSELKKEVPTSYKLFKGEEPFEEIKSFVLNGQKNSILVVQKGSRTLSDQFFRKFLINELVHDGSIPLAVMPS